MKRNDELALYHEKLKIYTTTLQKGERQYNSRIEEIRALRTALASLRRKLVSLERKAGAVEPYKKEITRLNNELLGEKTKTKALTQELQNPTNVHRWRQLEGKDPQAFELIKKVQIYQKRLIEKTEEIQKLNLDREEKERLYQEMKGRLERHPGPEVLKQVQNYRVDNQHKTKQLQALSGELAMFQAQAIEYKQEIEKLNQELNEVKRKYFAYKKREFEEMTRRAEDEFERTGFVKPNSRSGTGVKFVGGGFAIQPRTDADAEGPYEEGA